MFEVTDIVIANVDEQVKQNFERFCVTAGMNMTKGFSALVQVGISINEQGLLLNAADETRRQQRTETLGKVFAEAQKSNNDLSDEDWTEFANLRSQTNLTREVEKWFTP